MNILAAMLGAAVTLCMVWCAGHIAALRKQNKEGIARGDEAVSKLRTVEIEKEALQSHCNELRNVIGQLSIRPPIVYFTDEQISRLTQAILGVQTKPKSIIN